MRGGDLAAAGEQGGLTCPGHGALSWLAATAYSVCQRRALDAGIRIAPGPIFSAKREFRSCIRLNVGHPWLEEIEPAMLQLGAMME